MATLYLDTEAFNETPITSGTHRYAETAEIILVSYGWDAESATVADTSGPGEWEAFVPKLQWMIDEADEAVLHNSSFDRTVLRHRGVTIPPEKITDTMVCALRHSLPAGLDQLCTVLGVPTDLAKDKAGKKLIQLFCKPRARNMKLRRATRDTHPDEWAAFVEYARSDITSMRECLKRMPTWNNSDFEHEIWLLDQESNDRGAKLDLGLAEAALRAFDRTKKALSAMSADLTGGAVGSLTQRDKLLAYLAEGHGFELGDLQKGTVRDLLGGDLPDGVRELLELRQQAAAASPAKYKAALKSVSSDGRMRGMTQYCGASRTMRDAGRLVQFQNLPRPTLKPHQIETGIRAMKADCEGLLYDHC